jgi:hypothetical protein
MFSRWFLRLAPVQAARVLRSSTRLLALAAIAIAVSSLAPIARADTITEYRVHNAGVNGSATPVGQSVTTPTGGPWHSITFNFYDFGSNPFATGNLYLLDQAYAGTPAALSSSTTGYIGTGTASGGVWTFDPSVTLQASTQYFFYLDTVPGTTLQSDSANGYAGGRLYVAGSTASNYFSSAGDDLNFTLEGTASPAPIPGAGLLSYLVVGCGGLTAFRKKLRARAAALLAALNRTMPDLAH